MTDQTYFDLPLTLTAGRFKAEMWSKVAEELQVPWRAAEAMHWLLGEADMARRAGVTPFSLAAAVNAEGAQGTARHSPQRMHGPTAPQGVYARDVIQMPPRDMHSRGQSVPTVPPGAGNAPRREAYTTQAPPPTLAPAPPHAPPPAPAAVAAAAAAMAPKPVYHQAQKIEYAKTDYGEPSFAPMPGPGLAPIQHQPAQRTADYLPGIAELTTGVRPFSRGPPGPTGSGAPPTASTGPGFPGYSTHNPDSMRQKRRASSDAMPREDVQRRRIG